ncbi:PREDICTED: WD repeat-containing protein 91-like [Acropora digitifera]|uniref:WD repeat-containing protein 91-like n=1 Tax=Acropora digitifera TaxID=70779 RepID=UPI00077A2CE1|nr:PREDICTED: WD repeat-containing protein 91-like [Acropora digitifera]
MNHPQLAMRWMWEPPLPEQRSIKFRESSICKFVIPAVEVSQILLSFVQVDKIVDQLHQYILSYDIVGLRDFWDYLNDRFFKRLDYQHYTNVKKLEMCLLRLYIIHALQNSKNDKVVEFFEKYTAELQTQTEWREWFAIPFIKNPEQNAAFDMYFQRAWQDTFFLSLYNFLITLFHHMPMPTLLKYDEERGKMHRLEQEVLKLKEQVLSLAEEVGNLKQQKLKLEQELGESHTRSDTVEEDDTDEFCVISSSKSQKFLPTMKRLSNIFKDKQDKNKKSKDSKPQQQQIQGENAQAKLKRQQLLLHEQQKQLSLLEEEQLKSSSPGASISLDKPQLQESDMQAILAANDEDVSAKCAKSTVTKSQSFDRANNKHEEDENLLHRSKTLPGRFKTVPTERHEDQTVETKILQPWLVVIALDLSVATACSEQVYNNKANQDAGSAKTVHTEDEEEINFRPFIFLSQCIIENNFFRVWNYHPDIHTCASVMLKSPLLSLEWAPKQDRLVIKSTREMVVSLSCSPTGGAFVCSAAASKKSSSSSLRLSQSRSNEMSSMSSSSITGGSGGVLQCWDMKLMKLERQLRLEPLPTCINCTAYNHNGTLCISGGADGMIRLFDMRSFDCLNGWLAHEGEICSLQFSADETTVYSMGTDGKFIQWSVHRMGKRIADLEIQEGVVWCETDGAGYSQSRYKYSPSSYGKMFAFDAEGQYLLTCGTESGAVHKVGKNHGLRQVLSLPEHKSPVVSVDWSSLQSCYTCLTGSVDGTIQVTSLLKP